MEIKLRICEYRGEGDNETRGISTLSFARLTLLHALHRIDDRWEGGDDRSRIDNELLKCSLARDNTIVIRESRNEGMGNFVDP